VLKRKKIRTAKRNEDGYFIEDVTIEKKYFLGIKFKDDYDGAFFEDVKTKDSTKIGYIKKDEDT
jgi:hypothetical protein